VDPVVRPIHRNERVCDVPQRGLAVEAHLRLGQHHADELAISLADRMSAERILVNPPFRLLRHFDFCDQPARRRIPAGEFDAGCLANQAAAAIAPDEIFGPERLTVGERDINVGIVLRETRHLASAIDRHRELADPFG